MTSGTIPSEENLLEMARQHWKEHRPTLFAGLEKTGRLEEMLQVAVAQTLEAVQVLIVREGMEPAEAWAMVREEWILVPAEEPEDNDSLSQEAPSWLF